MNSNKKINWSKIGIWIAISFFLISSFYFIFQTFIYKPKPNLNALVLINEELLTLNDELTGLKIFYNDIELDKHLNDLDSSSKCNFIVLKKYFIWS